MKYFMLALMIIIGTCFATGCAVNPNASAADTPGGLSCTLLVPEKPGPAGQQVSVQFIIMNTSDKVLTLPWPDNTRLLLEWGILSVSIQDEKGGGYKYVPTPGRFIPLQRDHYITLKPREKVSKFLNLCWFRDSHYSHSPCSNASRYSIDIKYTNDKDSYWDNELGTFVEMDEVWKGETICNQVAVDVLANEKGPGVNSQQPSLWRRRFFQEVQECLCDVRVNFLV